MTDIIPFPLTTFAESETLAAFSALDTLKTDVPMADLSKMKFQSRSTGQQKEPFEALMELSEGFRQLAEAMRDAELSKYAKKWRMP